MLLLILLTEEEFTMPRLLITSIIYPRDCGDLTRNKEDQVVVSAIMPVVDNIFKNPLIFYKPMVNMIISRNSLAKKEAKRTKEDKVNYPRVRVINNNN
jgi:hypothetical protein